MRAPRYVFLDQNHWIYLARAYHGRPHRAAHTALLDRLLTAVNRDEVRLPISYLHLIELLRAARRQRRLDLADIFERFAKGWYVGTWPYVLPRELDRAVAQVLNLPTVPPPPDVFGRGLLHGLPPSSREDLQRRFGPRMLATLDRISELPGATLDLIAFPNEEGRGRQNTSIAERTRIDVQGIEEERLLFRSASRAVHRRAKMARYTMMFQDPSLDVDCELTLYRDRQWSRAVEPNDIDDVAHPLPSPFHTVRPL